MFVHTICGSWHLERKAVLQYQEALVEVKGMSALFRRVSACFKNADGKKELLICQGLNVSVCPFLQEGMFCSLEGLMC